VTITPSKGQNWSWTPSIVPTASKFPSHPSKRWCVFIVHVHIETWLSWSVIHTPGVHINCMSSLGACIQHGASHFFFNSLSGSGMNLSPWKLLFFLFLVFWWYWSVISGPVLARLPTLFLALVIFWIGSQIFPWDQPQTVNLLPMPPAYLNHRHEPPHPDYCWDWVSRPFFFF
jgi:hypothetical protein